jgi:hypothetical protein
MVRNRQSVAVPLLLTLFVLVGLTLSVARFEPIDVKLTRWEEFTGAQKKNCADEEREFHYEGVVDDHLNPYQEITWMALGISASNPETSRSGNLTGRSNLRTSLPIKDFSGEFCIKKTDVRPLMYLTVSIMDRTGRGHGVYQQRRLRDGVFPVTGR